jgi:hypothetical protein
MLNGVLWGIAAYCAGAFAGGYLVYLLSVNRHDRDLEAAMTGAFVIGPLAGLIGLVAGVVRARSKSTLPDTSMS